MSAITELQDRIASGLKDANAAIAELRALVAEASGLAGYVVEAQAAVDAVAQTTPSVFGLVVVPDATPAAVLDGGAPVVK